MRFDGIWCILNEEQIMVSKEILSPLK